MDHIVLNKGKQGPELFLCLYLYIIALQYNQLRIFWSMNYYELLAPQSQVIPIDHTVVQYHSLHKSIAGKLSYLRNQSEFDRK